MTKFYDFKEVKARAEGGWPGILSRLGVDAGCLTGRHSPCPGCGGKDRFRFDDKAGAGTWLCSGGGDLQSGDGVALVMHIKRLEWKDAVNLVGELLCLDSRDVRPAKKAAVAGIPRAPKKKMADMYNSRALERKVEGVEPVSPEWFMARSPVDPRRVTPGEFLNSIFDKGERALVFSSFFSQGDYGWEVGRGGYRLSPEEGVKAVKSALPVDGRKDGVWFLANPVSLQWVPNPRKQGEKSRRIKECVTSWKYLVLESDNAPEDRWLKFLAAFPDPIRAIYSSGGRSWHALVAAYQSSWASMDGLLKGNPQARRAGPRMGAKALWARYGADPGALTPVRLTRLPGCTRDGEEQRLIYLNPSTRAMFGAGENLASKRIIDLVPRREI